MKRALNYGYIGLVIGVLFEIISFLSAHICQIIFGSSPIEKCRVFVIEYYYLSLNFKFFSEIISYLISIAIIVLLFGIIGLVIGYIKDRKDKKHSHG